jgi:hypothetical protein
MRMEFEVDPDIKLKDLYSHETENHTTVHRRGRGGGGWDDDRLSYVTTVNNLLSYVTMVDNDHASYFLTVDDNICLFKLMTVSRDIELVLPDVVEGGAGSVDG